MMYQVILMWARIFLRIYFRKTIMYGAENIPKKGPLIVAANHPSSFMEASVVATMLGRPVHFLVRGDVFNPRFMWLFRWTKQIPIFRQKDGISNLRKNASSFDLSYRKLAEGEAILIFPEAKTELQKKLRPVQRGTAHLAFGTVPYLAEGQDIQVLPVGVNFMDPRQPGTDVVIRIGKPFVVERASRDDRVAIERFTDTLSEAMNPLVIQVEDHGYERHYDVLASVYLHFSGRARRSSVYDDLAEIAALVNHHEANHKLLADVHEFIRTLKKNRISEAIYFPRLLTLPKVILAILLIIKGLWFLAGGWLWRLTRKIIYAKIRAVTFQGPVSLGATMVIYPLATLLLFLLCLIAGWPLWVVPLWLAVMVSGMFLSAPLALIWGILMMKSRTKKELKKSVFQFDKLRIEN